MVLAEMKEFKGKKKRAEGRRWTTAIVLTMDESGRVLVDNSTRHFADALDRQATYADVVHMCRVALHEFEQDELREIVRQEIAGLSDVIRAAINNQEYCPYKVP